MKTLRSILEPLRSTEVNVVGILEKIVDGLEDIPSAELKTQVVCAAVESLGVDVSLRSALRLVHNSKGEDAGLKTFWSYFGCARCEGAQSDYRFWLSDVKCLIHIGYDLHLFPSAAQEPKKRT